MQTTTLTWRPDTGWSPAVQTLSGAAGSTVALAFADPLANVAEALAELEGALPGCDVVSCSTAGQILGETLDPAPIVAVVVRFASTAVHTVMVDRSGSSEQAGRSLGSQVADLTTGEQIAGVLVFGSCMDTDGQALANGLAASLPPQTPVLGGLAGDGQRFASSWVRHNGRRSDCGMIAVCITGPASVHSAGRSGWEGFGPRRTITRSEGNVLYEFDGQPALSLYKQYLGNRADELPASGMLLPLMVTEPGGESTLIRTVIAVDEDRDCMTFAGDVPQGWSSRFMWTTKEDLLEGAARAGEEAATPAAGLALMVSCAGRRLVLGPRAEEEIEDATRALGDVPTIGFYSYGPIAPMDSLIALQSQTMTITTICETSKT